MDMERLKKRKSNQFVISKFCDPWSEDLSECRQVRRTYIDEVNARFDFLAIPMKQVSGMGIRIFDLTTCENSAN